MKNRYDCILFCAGLLVATITLGAGVIATRDNLVAGPGIMIAALGLIGLLTRGIVACEFRPKKRSSRLSTAKGSVGGLTPTILLAPLVFIKGEVENEIKRAMPEQKKHVFLSYCRDNQAQVKRLRDDLIAAGHSVWWDQDIQPGQDWKFEVREAIQNAYAVVLCLSKESEARATSGIYSEAMDAINLYREYPPGSIFLIPVRLSPCAIPPVEIDGTRTLDRLHCQDLFPSADYAAGIQKLLGAIQNTPHRPQSACRK